MEAKIKIVSPSVTLEALTEPTTYSLPDNPQAQVIERAGRTCWKSEGKAGPGTADRFVKMIQSKNHLSVLEHCSATFRIVCDRGVSHELVRHRVASYSQESTRYVNYGKKDEIQVIPPFNFTPEDPAKWLAWMRGAQASAQSYLDMLDLGCKPQEARDALPTCLKTEIVMTANFREWQYFIKMRSSLNPGAHPKMQVVANMIWEELKKICPAVFSNLAPLE